MAVPTSVRLPDELNEKLTLWTNSHNISKSEFIAQVLTEKLGSLYDFKKLMWLCPLMFINLKRKT